MTNSTAHVLGSLPAWSLADLVVLLVVVLGVVGALRRGSGLLGAAAAGFGALVVTWLALVAVATWAPGPVAAAAERSAVLHTAPPPHRALAEAGSLVDRLLGDGPASHHTTTDGDDR